MDPPRYYDLSEKDNTYCVHFANKKGYSNPEIEAIFSEFGRVVAVTKAGDDYGFRFVRFREEEEAQFCIESLKNHPTIKLLPKRPKPNNYVQQNGQRKNWTNNKQESKTSWATWGQRESDNDGKFNQNNGQWSERRENNNHRSYEAEKTNHCSPDKNLQQSNIDAVISSEDAEDAELREERETQVQEFQEHCNSSSIDPGKFADLLNQQEIQQSSTNTAEVCNSVTTPKIAEVAAATTLETPILKLVTEEVGAEFEDGRSQNDPETAAEPEIPLVLREITPEKIPKLVKKSRAENAVESKNCLVGIALKLPTKEAHTIVVGNIHTDYGVHYILHLFQKHNPISASLVKIIPKHGLRYCIVYLQSPLQACDIEKEFDKYSLSGKELIVLRVQTLRELAGKF